MTGSSTCRSYPVVQLRPSFRPCRCLLHTSQSHLLGHPGGCKPSLKGNNGFILVFTLWVWVVAQGLGDQRELKEASRRVDGTRTSESGRPCHSRIHLGKNSFPCDLGKGLGKVGRKPHKLPLMKEHELQPSRPYSMRPAGSPYQ